MKWFKVRWLLAAASAWLGWRLMASGLRMEGFAAAPAVIFSMASFLLAVILTTPETAFRIAEWCSRPFAAIFFPSDEFSRPPLTYRLARYYYLQERWDDAARQYRKIIRYYPMEHEAYLELLSVADHLGDNHLRRRYAGLFRRRFKKEAPPLNFALPPPPTPEQSILTP